jgi:hypothetical protein
MDENGNMRPAMRDENQVVENLYEKQPDPNQPNDQVEALGRSTLDSASWEAQRDFVEDRHSPEPNRRTIDGGEVTRTVRVEGTRLSPRVRAIWERIEDWVFNPKNPLGKTILASLLATAIATAGNAIGKEQTPEIRDLMDAIYAADPDKHVTVGIDGRTEPLPHVVFEFLRTEKDLQPIIITQDVSTAISQDVQTTSEQDKVQVDQAEVDQFLKTFQESLEKKQSSGETLEISGAILYGQASDEYAGNENIGKSDEYNTDLARRRAEALRDAVEGPMREIAEKFGASMPAAFELKPSEIVISESDVEYGNFLAKRAGFDNLDAAVDAEAAGTTISDAELETFITEKFSSQRLARIEVEVHRSFQETTEETVTTEKETRKELPIIPVVIPIVPFRLPRYRRGQTVDYVPKPYVDEFEVTERLGGVVEESYVHPYGIEQIYVNGDEYYRLRGSSVYEWLPKIQHLFRDDRVDFTMEASYRNRDGLEQAFQTMFVDFTPDIRTQQMFMTLLRLAAQVQGGRLASKVNGIIVYPSENAGRDPDNPKKIALGQDRQLDASVGGTNRPLAKLVEMHMPQNPTDDELARAAWVLAHELIGHTSDIIDDEIYLKRVVGSEDPGVYTMVSCPWANRGANIFAGNTRLIDRNPATDPINFRGENGEIISELDVAALSEMAVQCQKVRIERALATKYGSTSIGEAWAEIVAALATGQEVPFEQADVDAVGGYFMDLDIEREVQDALGANRSSYRLQYSDPIGVQVTAGTIDSNPTLHGLSEDAKKRYYPNPPSDRTRDERVDTINQKAPFVSVLSSSR